MGQIYVIMNNVNGKCYVGQTVRTFHRRYDGGHWDKNTSSVYLKRASVKYGKDNFTVWILEEGNFPAEALNKKEEFWATELDSYAPNGYNMQGAGGNKYHHESTKQKIGNATRGHKLPERYKQEMRENWGKRVVCSDGREFPSIRNTAKEIGVCQRTMLDLIKGVLKHHKGLTYALKGSVLPTPPARVRDTSQKTVYCSNGKCYKNFSEAATDTGVKLGNVSRCYHNKQHQAKGITFARTAEELKTPTDQRLSGKPKIKVRVGEHIFNSLSEAAIFCGIVLSSASKSLNQHIEVCGFLFERTEP